MKLSSFVQHCFNPKVLLVIVSVIVLAYTFVPNIAGYAWVFIVLICPFSMVFMMKAMDHDPEKFFVCAECGLLYNNTELAKKCAKWCWEYHAGNSEITRYAIK